MVKRFAEGTEVSVEKSRAEIETILTRYGASAFGYAWQADKAMIQFEAKGRRIKFILPLPNPSEKQFTEKIVNQFGTVGRRTPENAHKAWEQACRQSWRALCLVIKAKLYIEAMEIVEAEKRRKQREEALLRVREGDSAVAAINDEVPF